MALNLSPQIEAKLTAMARQRGVEPETLVANMLDDEILSPNAVLEKPSKSALTVLLETWLAATPTDPEEIRKAEAERNEFFEDLNRNRIESGERPLFP